MVFNNNEHIYPKLELGEMKSVIKIEIPDGLTSNLVIFSQKVQYSVESPIDPSKGLMK